MFFTLLFYNFVFFQNFLYIYFICLICFLAEYLIFTFLYFWHFLPLLFLLLHYEQLTQPECCCCCSCSCSFNMLPTHGTSRRPAEATLCVILVLLLGLPLLLGLLLLSPCNFIYLLIIEYLFSIYLPLFAHAAC